MKKMKRKLRKQVSLLLAATLCLGCVLPVVARAQTQEKTPGQKLQQAYEESIANNRTDVAAEGLSEETYALYEEIRESMTVCTSEDGQVVYADFYAGSYINEENKLVVCVTDPQRMEEPTEYVVYKLVEYSYNALFAIQTELQALYAEYCEAYDEGVQEYALLDALVLFGISEEDNTVVVSLSDLDEEKAELFATLFGQYDCVELEELDGTYKNCATYKPGRAIFVLHSKKKLKNNKIKYTYARGSIGYRAYRLLSNGNKQYGFVTAGHVVDNSMNDLIYKSEKFGSKNVIGTVKVWKNNSKVDAAFVKIKDDVTISKTVQYSGAHDNYKDENKKTSNAHTMSAVKEIPTLVAGDKIYKVGSSTGRTSGKAVKFVKYADTKVLVMQTTLKSAEGDSGGIVYKKIGSSYYPVGIVRGSTKNGTVVITAEQIAEVLNVYPY